MDEKYPPTSLKSEKEGKPWATSRTPPKTGKMVYRKGFAHASSEAFESSSYCHLAGVISISTIIDLN